MQKIISNLVLQVAIYAGPVMTIPQLYNVLILKETKGVSIISWVSYGLVSLIWAVYSFKRKDYPVFINNVLYLIFCFSIVIGVWLFR
jgi:uncharacterized protein with PQ loop repeat